MSHEDRLLAEVAVVAHVLHWALDDIVDLEHPLRRRFVAEAERLASVGE